MVQRKSQEVQRRSQEVARKSQEVARTASVTSLDHLLAHCGDQVATSTDANARQSVDAATDTPPAPVADMTATPPPDNTACTCRCSNHHGSTPAADADPEDANSDEFCEPCECTDSTCCFPNCLQILLPLVLVGSILAGLLCPFSATERMIRHPLTWVYALSGLVVGFVTSGVMAVKLEEVPKGLGRQATRDKKRDVMGLTLLGYIAATWAFVILFKIFAMILE